ncbi:MAG: carboxypeptidase-like regulatory domain-containing protein [Lachnospiraceae bacterium]|nr:carboxypeptidase-like regulatory domain-containing protein [Lachnospiraceae bacterium]
MKNTESSPEHIANMVDEILGEAYPEEGEAETDETDGSYEEETDTDEQDEYDEYEEETVRKPRKKRRHRRRVALWKKLLLTLEFMILAAIILVAVYLVQSGVFEESDVVFGELSVGELYYAAGQGETAIFTIRAENSELEMQLCDEEENAVGILGDDGQNGDETAGDGIYTCTLSIGDTDAGAKTYHVREAKTTSNEVTVYVFQTLDAEALESACGVCDDVRSALLEIEAGYAGASGYVTVEDFADIFAEVGTYLETLVADGTVLRYVVEDESAYIKFASGLSLCYEPILEDTFSGEDDVQLTVTYLQNAEGNYAADCGETLDSALAQIENLENGETYKGSEVTLSTVKTLASDQVIVWYGHGSYSAVTGPALVLDITVENTEEGSAETGSSEIPEDASENLTEESSAESSEDMTENDSAENSESLTENDSAESSGNLTQDISAGLTVEDQADLFKDRLTTVYLEDGEQHLAVTAAYVEEYCGDLSNDLFFLSACNGGKDARLADAFLDCGAAAVLCFSDSVLCEYASGVIDGVLQYMLRAWPESECYYTLEQALALMESVLGENDAVWFEKYTDTSENLQDEAIPCGAEPVLLTREETAADSAGSDTEDGICLSTETGSLFGTVYYYTETPEPAAGATVTVRQEGELYAELTADENGSYLISALPVGTYDITFSLEGYGDYYQENVAVARDESASADGYFFANDSITGKVIDALTGEALADVEVELLIGDGETIYKQTVLTDENGDYTFDLTEGSKSAALSELAKYFEGSDYSDLLEGSAVMTEKQLTPEGLSGYTMGIAGSGVILFEKDGYVSGTVSITVTGFDSPDAGVTELAPQVEIGGYVYDANGNALGGVTVSAVVLDDGSSKEQEEENSEDSEENAESATLDSSDESSTAEDGDSATSDSTDESQATEDTEAQSGTGSEDEVAAGVTESVYTATADTGKNQTGDAENDQKTVSTAATGDVVNTETGVDGYYSLDFDMGSKITIRVTYSLSGYDTKTVEYEIDSSMVVDGKVQLKDVSLSRTKQVVTDTSYASSVVSFESGDPWTSMSDAMNPADALGEPDYSDYKNAVTLGAGGVLVLGFDVDFCNGDGIDIYIYEVGDDVETTLVEVSKDGENWVNVGTVDGSTSGIDIEDKVSASSTFRYIRLTDLGSHTGGWWPGADIDAVAVTHHMQ